MRRTVALLILHAVYVKVVIPFKHGQIWFIFWPNDTKYTGSIRVYTKITL